MVPAADYIRLHYNADLSDRLVQQASMFYCFEMSQNSAYLVSSVTTEVGSRPALSPPLTVAL